MVTTGVLPCRQVTLIRPAASSSRSARRLVSRLTPFFFNFPQGNGKVSLFVFHETWSSSTHTRDLVVLVAFAASSAHHNGTFTKESAFLRLTGAAAFSSRIRFL